MTDGDLSSVDMEDRRAALVAIRDRLAAEADDTTWEKHKAECRCVCGMGDGRTLVAILKELRSVLDAIDALPEAKEESRLDRISAGVAGEAANRRHLRLAVPDGP